LTATKRRSETTPIILAAELIAETQGKNPHTDEEMQFTLISTQSLRRGRAKQEGRIA